MGLVRYPFQLRPGLFVYLDLPADLTKTEVERIAAFMATLALLEVE